MSKCISIFYSWCFVVLLFASCTDHDPKTVNPTTPTEGRSPDSSTGNLVASIPYTVVNPIPHDTNSFTEGLLFHNGRLFESTGHTDNYPQSQSLFGEVDLRTGKILPKVSIDNEKYFGEGIAFVKDRVFQLTLDKNIGFLYDSGSYKPRGNFHYDTEGWGMTTNGSSLIMSDGSDTLTYRDPASFKPVRTLLVSDEQGPVGKLNELELIRGFLYANIWLTDTIVRIDTTTGKVVGRIDLSSIHADARSKFPGSLETNGIAWDPASDRILVTGKFWPYLYEISFPH